MGSIQQNLENQSKHPMTGVKISFGNCQLINGQVDGKLQITKGAFNPPTATKCLKRPSEDVNMSSLVCRIPLSKLPRGSGMCKANQLVQFNLKHSSQAVPVPKNQEMSQPLTITSRDDTPNVKEVDKKISSWMQNASELKHQADQLIRKGDIMGSSCLYLQSAMYFIKCGDLDLDMDNVARAVDIFEDTLEFFDDIERNLWKLKQPVNKDVENLIRVFSYKCQAVLYSHLYWLKCASLSAVISAGNALQRFNEELSQFVDKTTPDRKNSSESTQPVFPLDESKHYMNSLHLFNGHQKGREAAMLISEYHFEGFFSEVELVSGHLELHSEFDVLIDFMKCGIPKLKEKVGMLPSPRQALPH